VADVTIKTSIVLATSNRGKIGEFRALLSDLPVDLLSMNEVLRERFAIAEDGSTFEQNAIHKATVVANAVMMITLADDSGLEVDALGGRPGVRSARFAHLRATDAENNAALLAALAEVEEGARTARFRCVLALIDPWAAAASPPLLAEGRCEGSIAREPRGAGGFGYDPLFVVRGFGRTMAELSEREKNAFSHRALAAQALRPSLRNLLESRLLDAERITSV
jgi:XTP/dITP diphosphohydrolase